MASQELPPRTRRIHYHFHFCTCTKGTTSACAENTLHSSGKWVKAGNYLRVRGEYRSLAANMRLCMELPPRARRIPSGDVCFIGGKGTTSACAENTCLVPQWRDISRNYLRVRGEYIRTQTTKEEYTELPPRARRIQKNGWVAQGSNGTTSACAENTHSPRVGGGENWNYLRVRGEYINK